MKDRYAVISIDVHTGASKTLHVYEGEQANGQGDLASEQAHRQAERLRRAHPLRKVMVVGL